MGRQACLLIRRSVQYRTDAFVSGLRRIGCEVADIPRKPEAGDLLVLWNRLSRHEQIAKEYERAGGVVLVAENGWIGRDVEGHKLIALCRGHHNGAGEWNGDGSDRWSSLGLALVPWRLSGDHIIVLGQRGIGERGVAMPPQWDHQAVATLRERSRRPVHFRDHPGRHEAPEPDFSNAHAVVTWSSGAAIKAIVAGVPAFHGFDRWIGAAAARSFEADLETPFVADRLPMLRRLAWAQWRVSEIASGEAFACLLGANDAEARGQAAADRQ